MQELPLVQKLEFLIQSLILVLPHFVALELPLFLVVLIDLVLILPLMLFQVLLR